MNIPYRLYLRSFGRIVGRHDLWAANDEEMIQVATVLAETFSDRCDEFEIWRGAQIIRHGCQQDHAILNGGVPARILSVAKEAAERIHLDGWQQFDRRALRSLHELWKIPAAPDPDLTQIVEHALSVTGADMGNIQILDQDAGGLRIAAHQGFQPDFLDFFALVRDGEAACGSALKSLRRVIVIDVSTSPIFKGKQAQEVMLDSGARSVQSTPLMRAGRLLGMLSTHRRSKWRMDRRELSSLDRIAAYAAEKIAESCGALN